MKAIYQSPDVEIVLVEAEDIIATSPGTTTSPAPGGTGSWDW